MPYVHFAYFFTNHECTGGKIHSRFYPSFLIVFNQIRLGTRPCPAPQSCRRRLTGPAPLCLHVTGRVSARQLTFPAAFHHLIVVQDSWNGMQVASSFSKFT